MVLLRVVVVVAVVVGVVGRGAARLRAAEHWPLAGQAARLRAAGHRQAVRAAGLAVQGRPSRRSIGIECWAVPAASLLRVCCVLAVMTLRSCMY